MAQNTIKAIPMAPRVTVSWLINNRGTMKHNTLAFKSSTFADLIIKKLAVPHIAKRHKT